MKNKVLQRLGNVLAGKGFYIVLLLSAAALGVSGYYLLTVGDRPAVGPATVAVSRPPVLRPERPVMATPVPTPVPVPKATPKPTPTPMPTPETATATARVFTWPVKGNVFRGHQVERLTYDRTMGDWRTHDGVDIACAPGTTVVAPAGGTVADVCRDDLLGVTVTILHADGVMSTCANLAGEPALTVGDTVRTGDVIGSVGDTALSESGEEPHLHLAMSRNGESVDPLDYLPGR